LPYRFQALLLQRQEGHSRDLVFESLNQSLKYLEESGHQIELAKTSLELARQHLFDGEEDKRPGDFAGCLPHPLLLPTESLIPDDLSLLVRRPAPERKAPQ